MNLIELLNRIRFGGGEVGWRDGQVFLRFQSGAMTAPEVDFLRQNEVELDRLLRPTIDDSSTGNPFEWHGEELAEEVALDCETTLIGPEAEVPDLILVAVSDGRQTFCLKPEQLERFLQIHRDREFICHHAAFDYRVVEKFLPDPFVWQSIAEAGRLHDTMLLDQLIGLAERDSYPRPRNLAVVAKQWSGMELDKSDPYRMRYAELIGRDWTVAEAGFFHYAAADAEATVRSWQPMKAAARQYGTTERFGILTEVLQTQASIALAQITANGIQLDQELVEHSREVSQSELRTLVDQIQQLPEAEGLFKRCKKTAQLRMNAKSGKPSIDHGRLRQLLQAVANGAKLKPPKTVKTKQLTTSIKWWRSYIDADPFVELWVRLEQTAKLAQFFGGLTGERIRPKYQTLVRTGRTSCSGPNIQQLPRDGGFREMLVASPGFVLLTADYSAIELRTLACVCEKAYGTSQLAEVFRQKIDAHSYTAAMFAGLTLEQFETLPKSERKPLRQKAKALNFGIPGGLGAKSLVSYAQQSYGVELTIEEAEDFRQKLITEVYPELEQYLQEDSAGILADRLQADRMMVETYLPGSILGAAKKIVRGNPQKADGREYQSSFIDRVWLILSALNRNEELRSAIDQRVASEQLCRRLFWTPVETTTGRRRASVSFSQARNTPFQGLAADGAKLALWRLYRDGFRTVAFIHDEVVVELREEADHAIEAEAVVRLMTDSMAEVMESDIPIEVDFSLSRRWWKEAEEVRSATGELCLWSPE